MAIFNLSCKVCGHTFQAKTLKARFCSDRCRQREHRADKKAKVDTFDIASNIVKELASQSRQGLLRALFIMIASHMDDLTFNKSYAQIRDRGEQHLAQRKIDSSVPSVVTQNVTIGFENARAAFKLLAYHEDEPQTSEQVFSAIDDVRMWLNGIEQELFLQEAQATEDKDDGMFYKSTRTARPRLGRGV